MGRGRRWKCCWGLERNNRKVEGEEGRCVEMMCRDQVDHSACRAMPPSSVCHVRVSNLFLPSSLPLFLLPSLPHSLSLSGCGGTPPQIASSTLMWHHLVECFVKRALSFALFRGYVSYCVTCVCVCVYVLSLSLSPSLPPSLPPSLSLTLTLSHTHPRICSCI